MSLRFKLFLPPLLLVVIVALQAYWLPAYRNQTEQAIVADQSQTLYALSAAVLLLLVSSDLAELYAFCGRFCQYV